MNCKWFLVDKGPDGKRLEFDSEQALDLHLLNKLDQLIMTNMITNKEQLFNNKEELETYMGDHMVDPEKVQITSIIDLLKTRGLEISKVFDISATEKADAILSENQVKNIKIITDAKAIFDGMEDEFVKIHDHPDYIGVTELITTVGNPKIGWNSPIIPKLDKEKWRINKIEKLVGDLGFTEKDAIALADNEMKSWEDMASYGDEVHAIYQAIVQDLELPIFKKLTDTQVSTVIEQAKEFKASLRAQYGKDAKFYSEYNVATTNIDPDLKKLLPDGKKGISGTIDLMVRDKNGKIHIYDFKTSYKSPGDWNSNEGWHINKKTAIKNQLAAYAALLQQLGLQVASTHIVPIKMDYVYDDNKNITGLTGIIREETIHNIPESLGGKVFNNWRIMIPVKFKFDSETLLKVDRGIQHVLPVKSILSEKIEKDTKDVAYYRNKVYKLSPTSAEANKDKGVVYKYKFYPKELGKPAVYWKDDAEMERELNKFVEDLRDSRAKELDNIAINIQRTMIGELSLDDLDGMLSGQKKGFLINQMQRYINGGWEFIRDPQLNAFGIFIFQKDKRSEIIGITNEALGTAFNLSKGSSILGKTRYDKDVNSKEILDATTGNMELMRLMMYVAENQENFKENKITQIKVINPWHASQYVELNSVLKNNYNLLVQDNATTYDGKMKRITDDIFYDDVVSILSIADELLADVKEKSWGIYEFDRHDLDGEESKKYTEEWISKQIRNMRGNDAYYYLNNPDQPGNGDPRIWEAYNNLLRALLAVRGTRMVQEFDIDAYLNSGTKMGTAINSTGFSPSANIRIFDDIMQEFATEVRTEVEKLGRPLVVALKDFYKSKGKNSIIGGEYTAFKEWFVLNPDGTIDERFRLKDPDTSELPEPSKKALKVWLETLAKIRWPNATPEDIQKYKDSEVYYEVPLTEATFGKQTKSLGLFTAFKNKVLQYGELTKDVFAGETSKKMDWKNDSQYNYKLYNKFELKPEDRETKLRGNVGFFETDLEQVMNQAMVAYVKSNISPKYVARVNALSISLRLSASYGGQVQKETEKVLNKLINSKFYGESIIEGETMQTFARWLNVIKHGLSFMALGFSGRSFLREFLQGTWMGISRAGLNSMPGITKETYIKGYTFVLKEAYKNFSSVSLLQQLDAQMGIANYSLGNITHKRRLDWTGIRNWNSDTAFWGSTSPDFQHRVATVVAKMMGDGCWEAYSLNENGDLTYDWTKDKRFSIYADGSKLKGEKLTNYIQRNPEFANQRSLYMEHIMELNRLGKKIKDEIGLERDYQEGDALPQAYLPREVQAIKNYADLLYGHYDDESRSLIHDTFLGSFFMQFKTYITSRIEQWTLNPGTYNTELLQWEVDPIYGEHLYKVHLDPDPDGRPNIEIKRESQIENLEQLLKENKVEKYYTWKGIPMEGIARSYINFFKRFKGLNWENIKDVKNNPVERDNLILGLHDTLFASFMLLLITGLAGLIINGEWSFDHTKIAREARNNGWLPSFLYNVSYGSWTDFAPWNNAWSILGDWNPPALTSAKRVVQNAGAVIVGNKSLFQAVTNTFGAAADLKGIADKLADK